MAFASPIIQRVLARQISVSGYDMGIKRKRLVFPSAMFAVTREPTDAVGTLLLTLTNLVPGSAVHVQTAAGVPIYTGVAVASAHSVSLNVYSPGAPANAVRVRVRKGSAAPFYQPWSTELVLAPGAASVFVSQISDE